MADRKVLVGDPLNLDHTPWSPGDRLVTPDGEVRLSPTPLQLVFDEPGTFLFEKAPYVAAGYTMIDVDVGGGGGGGAGGLTDIPITLRRGGNGGGGGGRSRNRMALADLPDEIFNTVGFAGSGGAPGSSGIAGGESIWYYGGTGVSGIGGMGGQQPSIEQAYGGPGDIPGLHGAVHGDGTPPGYFDPPTNPYDGMPVSYYYPAAKYPGFPIPTRTINGTGYRIASYFGGGGGAGGSLDATNTIEGNGSRGAPGSTSVAGYNAFGPAGGVAPGGDGQNGADYQLPAPLGYMGGGAGGGGGAARALGGNGGNGGHGSNYGGGGGGGGAATDGEGVGGSGGNGYQGLIVAVLT